MAPEIRFTAFGIPYLVEFANVSFRPKRRYTSPLPSSCLSAGLSASSYTASTSTLPIASASSETLVHHNDQSDGQGLYIQYASRQPCPPQRLSPTRIARLKHRIADAVLAVGMDSPTDAERSNPMETSPATLAQRLETQGVGASPPPKSLFRGTYGQVMIALKSAGLTTTPCEESGIGGATRLGAIFVAKHTEYGVVEFTKLTLWA